MLECYPLNCKVLSFLSLASAGKGSFDATVYFHEDLVPLSEYVFCKCKDPTAWHCEFKDEKCLSFRDIVEIGKVLGGPRFVSEKFVLLNEWKMKSCYFNSYFSS